MISTFFQPTDKACCSAKMSYTTIHKVQKYKPNSSVIKENRLSPKRQINILHSAIDCFLHSLFRKAANLNKRQNTAGLSCTLVCLCQCPLWKFNYLRHCYPVKVIFSSLVSAFGYRQIERYGE